MAQYKHLVEAPLHKILFKVIFMLKPTFAVPLASPLCGVQFRNQNPSGAICVDDVDVKNKQYGAVPKGANFIALPEGDWQVYRTSPQWQAKQQANEISYLWDALIEHQSKFIRSGKAISVPWLPDSDGSHHERIVRALASQPRLAHRSLSTDLHFVMQRSEPGRMFARIKMTGRPPDRAFVFLTMPRTEGEDYNATYRHRRMHALTVCYGT